ncbi:MAG: glycosyltransferase family 4 protein [Campylobacterales bacterium]|nr:glycosyltransferase family 4 protein [Campylobacterales bacterium]
MNKTIWFFNDYAGSKYHGMEFRNYYFGKEFIKLGYEVYIFTASYSHLFKKLPQTNGHYTHEKIDGINYIWIKVPNYGESTNKMRVLKWFIFTLKLFFIPKSKIKTPDVVIASPMAPFLILPAMHYSKKYKSKLIYEVKDIWPLSIIELGNIKPTHPLIRMMSWCERLAVKKSEVIVSSLQNYGEHLKNDLHLERDFVWINNGIDLDEMSHIEKLDEKIANKIPKDKFIVGYTGTIGIANALEYFLEASKLLKDNKDILFVIVGDGKEKEKLLDKYGRQKNILFVKSIPKQGVQSMLQLFDVCFIGLKKESLFKYGVSPNKLFDYMYSGKSILYAIESGESNIVKISNCGLSIEAENPKAIADGIIKLYEMNKEERVKMGENGKEYVLEHFTYEKLAKKFEKIIKE